MNWLLVAGACGILLAGIAFGMFIGWGIWHPLNRLSIDDLRQEMDRRLQFEEIELAERKLRAEMAAYGRREMPRPNAGETTRISKIQLRREG